MNVNLKLEGQLHRSEAAESTMELKYSLKMNHPEKLVQAIENISAVLEVISLESNISHIRGGVRAQGSTSQAI